jgi:hypothetical protein
MYGSGARLIDLTNVSQITKTMNQLFLSKWCTFLFPKIIQNKSEKVW